MSPTLSCSSRLIAGFNLLQKILRSVKALGHEFEQRTVFHRFQLRLLGWPGSGLADELLIFRPNRVSRVRLRHLREQLRVDRAARRQAVRLLVSDQRLAEKLAHFAIDFARAEFVVVEKNLQPHACVLIVNRKRNQFAWRKRRGRHRRRRWPRSQGRDRSGRWRGRVPAPPLCMCRQDQRDERKQTERAEFHERKLSVAQAVRARNVFPRQFAKPTL